MTTTDVIAIALYAGLVIAIGMRVSRGHQSANALLLGERSLPTWAVLLSMVATELSAATFVGVPHAAYTGDWAYLQLAFGALLGKLVLSLWVIPLYHRLRLVTVYGFLAERFGEPARRAAALCFVAGRVLASGARLFIASLAFSVVTGFPIEAAIALAGAAAALYTGFGGLRAVVWTDVLQAAVFAAGAVAALVVLLGEAGGLSGLTTWAAPDERMRVLHLAPLSLSDGSGLATAIVAGFFLTLATHATDHDMVQRLLATRDGRRGGLALFGSALLNFPLTALFLLIGTGLAHLYAQPPPYDISDTSRIFPIFALHELPAGLRGLVFAGLFAAAMSSLDSAICAISTTWVSDVRPPGGGEPGLVRSIRRTSVATSVALIAAAMGMAAAHRALSDAAPELSLVEFALSSMSILYGGLLGVFAVGFATRRRGSARSAQLGLALGAFAGLVLFLHPILLGRTLIAWGWWIPISASLAAALVASRPGGVPARRSEERALG